MGSSSIDMADRRVIARQLGRPPRGVQAIVRRCDKGLPQVVLNSPLVHSSTPFPTVYWLTCPLLEKKVATLESEGLIKDFQSQMREDKNFQKAVLRAQIVYCGARKKMIALSSNLPDYAKEALQKVGIGGVADFTKVKCLHAHFAHYLATGQNPIGERVGKLIGEIICERECGRP